MAKRRYRLNLVAGLCLIGGLVFALSVLSYDPADPPAPIADPEAALPSNFLGFGGAWLAYQLFATFGAAAYLFFGTWFLLVFVLFLRRDFFKWTRRIVGSLLLTLWTASVAEYFHVAVSFVQPGGGGSMGRWIAESLGATVGSIGCVAIFAAAILVALALLSDVALVRGLRWSWSAIRAACRWLGRSARWAGKILHRPQPAITRLPMPGMRSQSIRGNLGSIKKGTDRPAKSARKNGADIPIHHHARAARAAVDTPAVSAEATIEALVPIERPKLQSDNERFADYELPPLALLEEPEPFPHEQHDEELRTRAALLEKTFADFDLNVRVVGINTGPVITQYEITLETGLRLNKITALADDLALNLRVPSVRIVAPIPGKNTVGIEIPNEHRAVVRLKEVLLTAGRKVAKAKIPLCLGKDTEGQPLVYDLAEMPHLLIAGRTGTGKSVCMNAIILSILMTRRPDAVKMVMIDPKMLELSEYGKIPHLMHPVVKDMKKAEAILAWAVDKMEERYDLLSRARVRGIAAYNELATDEIFRRVQPTDDEERSRIPTRMPYIVIFVDEMNDLMIAMKKEVEGHIIRLAQKSRAAGIHLVVATQKPTVDVITGLIKSNLPARICFQVSSRSDSRVVLDEMGADKLLGKGDMLFLQPGTGTLIRAQGTYASDREITSVVERIGGEPCYAEELIQLRTDTKDGEGSSIDNLRARDDLYEQAIEVVLREGRGSVSLLQRALGIGYGRAARLIDFMAEDGIVGDYNGSQARDVLYTPEEWQQLRESTTAKLSVG
jgi:S-DNA-T family DNA segregation ATPase FtsK/SpoIIIE